MTPRVYTYIRCATDTGGEQHGSKLRYGADDFRRKSDKRISGTRYSTAAPRHHRTSCNASHLEKLRLLAAKPSDDNARPYHVKVLTHFTGRLERKSEKRKGQSTPVHNEVTLE